MHIDVAAHSPTEIYPWIVGLVNPRPIAWVTTLSTNGVINLAPFSFFNAFGASPPVVVFSPTLNRAGEKKDTLRNVEATGEFVINVSTARLAGTINLTSREVAPDVSEVELAQLHTVASVKVKPPRVKEAPAALECIVKQIIPMGSGPIAANLVIGEVVMIHVDDEVLSQGTLDPRKLQTIGRMGGAWWCQTTDLFELPRP